MPSRYIIRNYAPDNYYHIFNCGLNKQDIFLEGNDYKLFLYYLFIYTAPINLVLKRYKQLSFRLQGKNLSQQMKLVAYCLMPNHYHLLVFPQTKEAVPKLMRQIANAYTTYFNRKKKREGYLFSSRYKAVAVESEYQLLHLSRYIHLNPVVAGLAELPEAYPWSSGAAFLGGQDNQGCYTEPIINAFKDKEQGYRSFLADQIDYARDLEEQKHLLIDTPRIEVEPQFIS